ncbi:MAG: hypothetical protein AB1589_17205 [Cyanobacteriota bacterium]
MHIRPLEELSSRTGNTSHPTRVIFSCGVGVPPAQKFDEKDFLDRSIVFVGAKALLWHYSFYETPDALDSIEIHETEVITS